MKKIWCVIFFFMVSIFGFGYEPGKPIPASNLIPVCKDGKWGFINDIGQIVINFQFQEAGPFSEGMAKVKIADKWGYIDEAGKLAIEQRFEDAWSFAEGVAGVLINNKYGFIDRTGKVIIEPQYIAASSFSEGLAAVALTEDDDKPNWGYIDKSGQSVIRPNGALGLPFQEGLAPVKQNGKLGFINKSGNPVFTLPYSDAKASTFSEGLAALRIGSKWGFIDKTGTIIIPIIFQMAGDFSEGLAQVQLNDKSGFINSAGKVIITFQFECVQDFSDGLAAVCKNGQWGVIDRKGRWVIAPIYERISVLKNHVALASIDHSTLLIDSKGNKVLLAQLTIPKRGSVDGRGWHNYIEIIGEEYPKIEPPIMETNPPIRVMGKIKPPKLLKSVDPLYPIEARISGVEGDVILEVITDIRGRIESAKVLKSIPLLDEAAVEAVRFWVYEPLIIEGTPRRAIFMVTVNFNLK